MALSVDQLMSASYAEVVMEMKSPANQWNESAALRLFEKQGVIDRRPLGDNIEMPIDYRVNPDTAVLANDQDAAALLNTEVFTSAVYEIAQISVPVTWTRAEEVKNPTQNQKFALVRGKLENGINSHDDLLEQTIFVTSAAGGVEILGLDSLVPDSGQGTVGGISAVTETWWRNFADTYTDATDIEATMTEAYNEALKGSGSTMGPKFLVSGAEAHALFESVLQSQQRFVDVKEADGGYKTLMFKSLPYAFSQYGDDHIYFLNPKSYKMIVSAQAFRDKGETETVPGQNASYFLIYSALQNCTNNKSRLAVISQA